MYTPLRVFATLVLVVSVVSPVLSTPLGYVLGPSKLGLPIDSFVLFAALLTWLLVIKVTH